MFFLIFNILVCEFANIFFLLKFIISNYLLQPILSIFYFLFFIFLKLNVYIIFSFSSGKLITATKGNTIISTVGGGVVDIQQNKQRH